MDPLCWSLVLLIGGMSVGVGFVQIQATLTENQERLRLIREQLDEMFMALQSIQAQHLQQNVVLARLAHTLDADWVMVDMTQVREGAPHADRQQ